MVQFNYEIAGREDEWDTIRMEGVAPNDHIYRVIRSTETFYELDLLRYLQAIFSRRGRPLAIDVGANIGNHAVFFARYLASHVIAIEPNPAVLPVLERNLRNNADESSWSILATALGAREGTGAIELETEHGANIGMTRVRPARLDEVPTQPVTVTTLDRVVRGLGEDEGAPDAPVGLIKIDVEGMEVDVLRGASWTIERFAPDIVVEAVGDAEKARIDELLEPAGYATVSRHCATPTFHYVKEPSRRLQVAARISEWFPSLRWILRWT